MEEIKINLDNLTGEEREQLMKFVEKGSQVKVETPKFKVWKPEYKEDYFVIETNGNVECYIWNDDEQDQNLYEIGNCYKTNEEAEFVIEKRKVETELQRFADEHNDYFNIYDENCNKYYISYFVCDDCLYINFSNIHLVGNITYFSSEEITRQAIKTIGEDRIKKYIFGIK